MSGHARTDKAISLRAANELCRLAKIGQRDDIADGLEQVHVGDLPGPEEHKHWVRFALNRQAAAIRRQS